MEKFKIQEVRPYQLMCIICSLGGKSCNVPGDPKVGEIWKALRNLPNAPVMLRCNTISVYRYQNPGMEDDTPEGELFNISRDLSILQKLGLTPGSIRPAHELFLQIIENIPSVSNICGFDKDASETWKGCPLYKSNNYEDGIKQGIGLLYPCTPDGDLRLAKKAACEIIAGASCLKIRPHHLLCSTAFFNNYGTEKWLPAADNPLEVWERILKEPYVPVELVPGPCMICPGCIHYDAENNLCVGKTGIGLRDEKKDLNLLQIVNLKYGDILPAKDLLTHVYSKIADTVAVCAWHDSVKRSPEWRVCNCSYVQGREKAIKELKLLP